MKSSELVEQLTKDIFVLVNCGDLSKHELEVFVIRWLLDNNASIVQLK